MQGEATTDQEPDSGYPRLEQQIRWYDSKSGNAQWWYKRTKVAEFLLGGAIPLTATWNGIATGILGIAALALEGLQQLNQWQSNWITYRSTCEALRHEKYSYLARAGVYDNMTDVQAHKVLVQRVEALVSTEHAKWISRQEYKPAGSKSSADSAATS
jgi:hypothetical protein